MSQRKSDEFNLSKEAKIMLAERKRRNMTPENSFFEIPKSSRSYNKEHAENLQVFDPRSQYRF